jgi:hypothetical protein
VLQTSGAPSFGGYVEDVRTSANMSSTGHKYVYRNKQEYGKPYYVSRKINGKEENLGYFATIEDALSYTATLSPTNPNHRLRDRDPKTGRFTPCQTKS